MAAFAVPSDILNGDEGIIFTLSTLCAIASGKFPKEKQLS
jgi:hypothetical protein